MQIARAAQFLALCRVLGVFLCSLAWIVNMPVFLPSLCLCRGECCTWHLVESLLCLKWRKVL